MIKLAIKLLKRMKISPRYMIADAGYDSEDNHFIIREDLGSFSVIKPNPKKSKTRKYSIKKVKKAIKIFKQTLLNEYIPVETKKKEYRICQRS